jgi:hypothetical protein
MPDLQHTLQGNDLGFLKMVAGAWGIDLNAPDVHSGMPLLVNALLSRQLVNEVIEALPDDAQHAFQTLLKNEGRMPSAMFVRRFGEVRAIGAARRDRERPDLKPASPAEVLWYRALIGKAFLNAGPEPQEYVYIPDDLLDLMNPAVDGNDDLLGRLASPGEKFHPIPANDRVLDHACTLLAALRLGFHLDRLDPSTWEIAPNILQSLLFSAGLIDERGIPIPEPTRTFLEADRAQALAHLAREWMGSVTFNELRLLPGLKFEGEWRNDPLIARQTILNLLSHLPEDHWWSLSSFVSAVAERYPDFQRPAGDYDSWFIRRLSDGVFLRGFSTWDEVDGALIRFLITGPLHWLGIFDLAAPAPGADPTAFRPSGWASALWHGSPPTGLPPESQLLKINTEGQVRLSPLTPRSVRYQIARFCQWEHESAEEYRYRITPTSLERARQGGLKTSHLMGLLRKYNAGPLPPSLLQALDRWEKLGAQAHFENIRILRLASADILNTLRQSRAGRHLGEVLNPTTVIIRPGGEDAVLRALAEMGYLAED